MNFDIKLIEDLETIVIHSLPKILGVIAFIIIGWLLINLILFVIKRILKFSKIEVINEKINENDLFKSANITISLHKILLVFLKWFLVLVLVIIGADLFNLEMVSSKVGDLINFLPTIFSALLIFFVGIYLASYFKNALRRVLHSFDVGGANAISSIVFYVFFNYHCHHYFKSFRHKYRYHNKQLDNYFRCCTCGIFLGVRIRFPGYNPKTFVWFLFPEKFRNWAENQNRKPRRNDCFN